ncbi:TPA: hypothetical protein TZY47_002273, partial [Streptococcus suis]|nr:hypothetical protein [Streptococcus suis]
MAIFKGIRIQTVDGRNAVVPVTVTNGFSSVRLYRTRADRTASDEETDSGFTITPSTGGFSGTASATYNGVGVYSRSLSFTDSSGRATPLQDFKIWVMDATVNNTSLTNRLYNHTPSQQEVLDAVTVLTGGSTIGYEKKLVSPIPTTNGTATVRITTRQGVYKDVHVPITYRANQVPTVTVSGQFVDRGGKTAINVSTGVTVTDVEDDRYPNDSLTTTITYTVKDLRDSTVYHGNQPNVPVEKLVAGIYRVTVTAADSGGASTEQTYVLNVTDRNSVSASVSASESASTSAS